MDLRHKYPAFRLGRETEVVEDRNECPTRLSKIKQYLTQGKRIELDM